MDSHRTNGTFPTTWFCCLTRQIPHTRGTSIRHVHVRSESSMRLHAHCVQKRNSTSVKLEWTYLCIAHLSHFHVYFFKGRRSSECANIRIRKCLEPMRSVR